ncbi:hypothetical protein Tco_0613698 [Tanacetum coccineum]
MNDTVKWKHEKKLFLKWWSSGRSRAVIVKRSRSDGAVERWGSSSRAVVASSGRQKLIGPNFIDWYRQLRIVLSIDDKLNYLEQPLPPAPVAPAGQHVAPEILAAHTAWVKGSKEIAGLMLMTMEPEIQRNLENLHANDMLMEL